MQYLAEITDNVDEKILFQFCNINIAKNGEKAFLADVGITKEDYVRLCKACSVLPVDIEACLKEYDTNWDQYYVQPEEIGFWVKELGEADAHTFVQWYPVVKPFSGNYSRDIAFE